MNEQGVRCFYFGVWEAGRAGHYLYGTDGLTSAWRNPLLPFRPSILDAGLIPDIDAVALEGRAFRNVINGWTVVSFWDRSGDERMGSNSSFIVEGDRSFVEVMKIAREQFPGVVGRFKFEVRLHEAQ